MLPEFIEPIQLAKEQKLLTGQVLIKDFTRVTDLLAEHNGHLAYTWQFSMDEHQRVLALLTIKAKLILECQRCQGLFDYPLEARIAMRLINSEAEAEALPLELQPLYVDIAGRAVPFDIIEDELILNIPEFPKHEKKDCGLMQNQAYYGTPSNGVTANTYKPFAHLKVLSKEKK